MRTSLLCVKTAEVCVTEEVRERGAEYMVGGAEYMVGGTARSLGGLVKSWILS